MTKLIWNNVSDRYFETGVDRGVFYMSDGFGVVWNGLLQVTEAPSGSENTPYYIDGIKYNHDSSSKEFAGSIEAYTYPDEFLEYEGWETLGNGLSVDGQQPKPFGFSYRTLIGNDLTGPEHGYKIHFVYNALAVPSDKTYASIGDEVEPVTFSWDFTTSPEVIKGHLKPLAHLVIDSTKTNPTQMSFIEQYIYGTPSFSAMLPPMAEMLALFENPFVTAVIGEVDADGLRVIHASQTLEGDLRGRYNEGLFVRTIDSRLVETADAGFYTLES